MPSYEEVRSLLSQANPVRTTLEMISPMHPFPLPECRLNEWACIIDRQRSNSETLDLRRVPLFGLASGLDVGTDWFKGMSLLGYKFKNFNDFFEHGH